MKTIIYLMCIVILIIAGCDIDYTTSESKASLDWQMKQSEKYFKKAIEIDSNKMTAFGNYSILLNIIIEFETSRKLVGDNLRFVMNSTKFKIIGSNNQLGENTENEALLKTWATKEFKKGSIALFEKRNPKKALRNYNRGMKLLPDDGSLLLMSGLCKYELGNRTGALEDWSRLISLGEEIDMNEYTALIENMKGYNELMAIMNK